MNATETDDRGLGLTLAFGVLAAAAALYTLVAPTQMATAVGFAVAVTVSVLAVAAVHVYW